MKISIIINLKFSRGMGAVGGKGRGGKRRDRGMRRSKELELPLKCRAVKSP